MRPSDIGLLYLRQIPKSPLFIFFDETCKLLSFCSVYLNAASLTVLLLIAFILEILPIAFSGAIGFVSSRYLTMV
jgi:hypothetical protein